MSQKKRKERDERAWHVAIPGRGQRRNLRRIQIDASDLEVID